MIHDYNLYIKNALAAAQTIGAAAKGDNPDNVIIGLGAFSLIRVRLYLENEIDVTVQLIVTVGALGLVSKTTTYGIIMPRAYENTLHEHHGLFIQASKKCHKKGWEFTTA